MTARIDPLPTIFFEAQWPKSHNPSLKGLAHKIARFAWDLISVVIFPIGLIRIAIKWLKNKVLRLVVPGNIDKDLHLVHFKSTWQWIKAICQFLYNSENFKIDRDLDGKELLRRNRGHPLHLTTPDKVQLDGAFYPGKIANKAIIYATGNSGQWENDTPRLGEILKSGVSVVVVNPRGVGKNKDHRSEAGYALDTYAAYEFLIKQQKIDPNNIVLVGFSKGGAYGTCGAAMIQEEYPDKKIKAININSYANLQQVVETVLDGRGLLKWIGRIAATVLRLNLYPKAAWDKLKGEKWIIYNPHDQLISKPVSLYRAVKENPVGVTKVLQLHNGRTSFEHNRHFDPEEETALQIILCDLLNIRHSFHLPETLKIKTFAA